MNSFIEQVGVMLWILNIEVGLALGLKSEQGLREVVRWPEKCIDVKECFVYDSENSLQDFSVSCNKCAQES
jgi:hypothetical protein